jgi:hypothetical protein
MKSPIESETRSVTPSVKPNDGEPDLGRVQLLPNQFSSDERERVGWCWSSSALQYKCQEPSSNRQPSPYPINLFHKDSDPVLSNSHLSTIFGETYKERSSPRGLPRQGLGTPPIGLSRRHASARALGSSAMLISASQPGASRYSFH